MYTRKVCCWGHVSNCCQHKCTCQCQMSNWRGWSWFL